MAHGMSTWPGGLDPGLQPQHMSQEQQQQQQQKLLHLDVSGCTAEDPASQCHEAELPAFGPSGALNFCAEPTGKLGHAVSICNLLDERAAHKDKGCC